MISKFSQCIISGRDSMLIALLGPDTAIRSPKLIFLGTSNQLLFHN